MPSSSATDAHDRRLFSFLAVLTFAATSCNVFAPTEPLDIAGGALESISISGDTLLDVGDTLRLMATGNVSGVLGMFSYDPLADARWSTSNVGVASVAPRHETSPDSLAAARAMVRGVRAGTARIIVSARGVSASWPVHVRGTSPNASRFP